MDVEADLLRALRHMAGLETGSDFTLRDGDVAFAVDYVGGSSSRLILRARYDEVAHADVADVLPDREVLYRESGRRGPVVAIRPMAIVLTSEGAAEREAKEEGLSREHQTGDASFDAAVYVDSPTTDDGVLRAVLSDAVRAATMELLSLGFTNVVLDDRSGNVTAMISSFAQLGSAAAAAPRIVRAFANLLRGLPPVGVAAGTHARSTLPGVLALTGGLAALVAGPIGFFGIAGAHDCTEPSADGEGVSLRDGCGGVAGMSLLLALTLAGASAAGVRFLARPRIAGHSDSHRRLTMITTAAFAWTALFAFLAGAAIGYAGR